MSKLGDILSTHRRRILVPAAVFGVAVVALGVFGYYQWTTKHGGPVKVNGKEISQKELSREAEIAGKIDKYIGGNGKKSDKTAEDTLVERRLMDIAASENGIKVTSEEIDARVKEYSKAYGDNQQTLYDEYGKAFGFSADELKVSVSYEILKEKLEPVLLKYKSGRFVYARSLSETTNESVTGIKEGTLDTWAKNKIESFKTMLDGGKSFEDVYNLAQNDPVIKYPILYVSQFEKINSESTNHKAEKDAILATNKGSYSEIAKTGSYYAIYFVDEESNGRFNTWEGFIKAYKSQYVTYGIFSHKQLVAMNNFYNGGIAFVNRALGTNIAYAACDRCAARCHGATVNGTVTIAGTGTALSGVSLSIYNTGSGSSCGGSSSSSAHGWCGPKTGTATSSSSGYYQFGRTDGQYCFVNCAWGNSAPWRLSASRSGFSNYGSSDLYPANESILTHNFSMTPLTVNYTLTAQKTGTGSGSISSSPAGISCGGTCSHSYTSGMVVSLSATPSSTSLFTGWTGCDGVSGTTCTVTMNANKTVTAGFKDNPQPQAGTCSLAVSPTAGEHPLAVKIKPSFNIPADGANHVHPRTCCSGIAPNITCSSCDVVRDQYKYSSGPTWYKIYWQDSDGNVGVIKEAGSQTGTTSVSVPNEISFTFPKALLPGKTYSIMADFKFFADGCNYNGHLSDMIVSANQCDTVSGIKVRESQGGAVIEIAP